MIIGIDLGTTNSLCAYYDGSAPQLIPNASGSLLTPSEVHLGADIAVGNCPDPQAYPHHFRFFKEYMGTDKVFQGGDRSFTPVELSALVLKQLKADAETFLGEEITEAVISVPAYFNDNQRIATKQAGQLAGLNTTRLVNEPSAAALAYQFGFDEASLLIFDFGGGTFDVSVVDCFDNIIEILAISGDNHLGGKNIDNLLAEAFCNQFQLDLQALPPDDSIQLLRDMEVIKEKLAHQSQILYSFQGKEFLFTRPLLHSLSIPLFQRMRQIMAHAVRESEKELQQIDQVILVGGSSCLSGLPQFIQELMGKKPLLIKNPQTLVALGMGYYVGIKSRHQNLSELILTDVCPYTLGVATVHNQKDINPHLTPLIPRNSTLPATEKARFVTVHLHQREISLKIFQGESYFTRDCLHLSTINIPVEKAPPGEQSVLVTFTYDFNGILQVDVLCNGKETTYQIFSAQAKHYSEEQLLATIKSLNNFKLAKESPQNNPLVRKANKFYSIMGREEKEMLRSVMNEYRIAQLETQVAERKAERKLRFLLDKLEEWEQNTFVEEESFVDFLANLGEEEFSLADFSDDEDDFPFSQE